MSPISSGDPEPGEHTAIISWTTKLQAEDGPHCLSNGVITMTTGLAKLSSIPPNGRRATSVCSSALKGRLSHEGGAGTKLAFYRGYLKQTRWAEDLGLLRFHPSIGSKHFRLVFMQDSSRDS